MWPEVEKARAENRHELVLGGSDVRKRIDKTGLDPEIFKLTSLNYLDIHDTSLGSVPDEIAKLSLLQSLVLHSNKLREVNVNIASLSKLKLLDLSRNQLQQVPPEIHNLTNIVTFNFAHNELETFPTLLTTHKLAVVDLSNNKLTKFPDVCHKELVNLAEIKLNDNQIEVVPPEVSKLPALKVLELGRNKIKNIPGELADCSKLKVLDLQHNPIADRRLKKLIEQCKIKQIVDYVKSHCPKQAVEQEVVQNTNHVVEVKKDYKYVIRVHNARREPKVVIDDSLNGVRYFFFGFLIHNVDFTEETFKKFIQVQNKLHDTICCKRNAATIATHDFDKLPLGDLQYTTQAPTDLQIHPLNRPKPMSAADLFARLQAEAENLRKEKKRSTYSGIHKYLGLLEGRSRYPCVVDSKGVVISFPPITNSEVTKIEIGTKTIFTEITSSLKIDVCLKVMQAILKEMVHLLGHDLEVTEILQVNSKGGQLYPKLARFESFEQDDDIQVVTE